MVLGQARCASYGFQPNPLHQLPFAMIVTIMEPGLTAYQFTPMSKLGILLRNPSASWMG